MVIESFYFDLFLLIKAANKGIIDILKSPSSNTPPKLYLLSLLATTHGPGQWQHAIGGRPTA